jgi:hypothetical protein
MHAPPKTAAGRSRNAGKRARAASTDPSAADLKKITVQVAADDLAAAQACTGEGVTETVRAGLKRLASIWAQQELLRLRGTFKFTIDLDELREDRKW